MAKKGNFIKINGHEIYYPSRGLAITHTNFVDNARNLMGTVFGEVIGRTQTKIELSFPVLSSEEWHYMLSLINDFFVQVEYFDPLYNTRVTREMYIGDRDAKPYWIDDSDNPIEYHECKFNLVDRGVQ